MVHPHDLAVAPMLDAVASGLRSGATLKDALDVTARHGPLAPVMRSVLARADSGSGLRDALDVSARTQPSSELQLAFAAMTLALDTGAAHASTLDTVAQRARDRLALAREVRAMSASARTSATVVSVAPVAFGAFVYALDPAVLTNALASTGGRVCIPTGLLLDAAGGWWMRRLVDRAALPRGDERRLDDLPEAVDLVGLAMAAGLGVPAAITAVCAHAPGEAGRQLRLAAARLAAGATPADAMAAWPRHLGDPVRPLVAALLASHHDGAPAGAALERLAADLRHARRQRAAERVQRLPVLLVFPLVCCVLPAFVLLTVLPLAIGSISALRG
jgi:Flp pilus assembly protein TadB